MRYSGNDIDFMSLFGGSSPQQQLDMQNQADYDQSIKEQGFAERVNRIINDPNWNNGQYEFTETDFKLARQGRLTPALKTAELVKRYAELYNIPLEEFDPDNPYLSPLLVANEQYDGGQKKQPTVFIPDAYKYGPNPADDTFFDRILKGGSRGQEKLAYGANVDAVNEAMYRSGMSGKEIAQMELANNLYNSEAKELDTTNALQKFLGLDSNNQPIASSRLSPEATTKAKELKWPGWNNQL